MADEDKQDMMRAIVGFEIEIERIDGKLKLSQNRELPDRDGVIRALSASEDQRDREVARLMKAKYGTAE